MKSKVSYTDIFRATWKSLISQCWLLMGLIIGFTIIYSLLLLFTIPSKGETISISGIIVSVLCLFLFGLFVMGFLKNCLQTLDKEEPQFSAYGQVSQKLLGFIAAYLLYSVIIIAGLALFIFPGIYLALRLQFFYASMVDEDTGLLESFKRSWDITKGQAKPLFVLSLIQLLVCLSGIVVFIIGIFVAIPLMVLMYSYTYRKLTAPATE